MKPNPNELLKESATTWLCILFSLMWMGLGIWIWQFALEPDLRGRAALVRGPLILLAAFVFVRGACVCFRSVIFLFKR